MRPDEASTAYAGKLIAVTLERWGDDEREIVEHPGASARFLSQRMHLFLAEGVERGRASPKSDEELELVRWPVDETQQHLAEIEDAKTLAGLLLSLRLRRP